MSVVSNNILAGASGQGGSGYEIERSLRFNSGDSAYLNRTPSAAGNKKTWTWSGWFKNSFPLTGYQSFFAAGANGFTFRISTTGAIETYEYSGGFVFHYVTTAVFRDPSAWYHIVLAVNTDDATASDRIKIYVNGSRITAFATSTSPSLGATAQVNNTVQHEIGTASTGTYLNGYLADVHFIDGQALAPTDFGETDDNGVWQPKKFEGTYGPLVNQSQTWSTTITTSTLANTDPAYYAKLYSGNPDNNNGVMGVGGNAGSSFTLTIPASIVGSTISVTSVYSMSFQVNGGASNVKDTTVALPSGTRTITITGTGGSSGTASGVYIDGKLLVDSGVSIADNSFHLPFTDNSSNAALGYDAAGSNNWTVNNLTASAPGLATANQGFDVVAYTGDGNTGRSISSLSFSPDLVWFKNRGTANYHQWHDRVRGPLKRIYSNSSDAENNYTTALTSFDSNGWTMGNGTPCNASGNNYVAWCWKAGGAASSNANGTVTSSVSANNTYGFSIVSWTAATNTTNRIGHSLNSTPSLIITKSRSNANSWRVWTAVTGKNKYLGLDSSSAVTTYNNYWSTSEPNSSTFGVWHDAGGANNDGDMIAYCWSEIAGFSKISSYAGSNSSQTIECGFEPAFVMIKCTTSGNDWIIQDNARGIEVLRPNTNDAEFGGNYVSFTSTGFTLNTSDGRSNSSGDTYIYAAFAEQPDGSVIDSLIDTPTNATTPTDTGAGGEVVGNYATMNPLNSTSTTTLSDGNLAMSSGGGWGSCMSTVAFTGGKFYYETTVTASSFSYIGASLTTHLPTRYPSQDVSWALLTSNGYCYYDQGGSNSIMINTGTTVPAGAVVGTAIDADNGKIWWSVNGSWIGSGSPNPATGSDPIFTNIPTDQALVACLDVYGNSATVNFGQRAFAYPVSGYKALCTSNLPEPTIADGSKYFDTKLYTGTRANQVLTFGMQPDFIWAKNRSQSLYNHVLTDSVRGAQKIIFSNLTNAEQTSNSIIDWDYGTNQVQLGDYGQSSETGDAYVAWAWDAGDTTTTIAAGSLNSSTYNQDTSTVYTNQITGVDYSWAGSATNGMFDGRSDTVRAAGSSSSFTWNTSIAVNTLRIKVHNEGGAAGQGGTFTVTDSSGTRSFSVPNSSNADVTNGTLQFTNVPVSGTLTQIVCNGGSGGYQSGIAMVEIDGKILVDYGVAVPNVPSIASTVRANPSAGFSIVKYNLSGTSSQTIAHGLGNKLGMLITKATGTTNNWAIWHSSTPTNWGMSFDVSSGGASAKTWWDQSKMTSSVFNHVAGTTSSSSGGDVIAYCFSPVESYSAMGSFEGNGIADGPFIYTGFRPSFIMIRNIDNYTSLYSWYMFDTTRDPDNVVAATLKANEFNNESSNDWIDILSNGFKIKTSSGAVNLNLHTNVWIAFAENPFKTARAR